MNMRHKHFRLIRSFLRLSLCMLPMASVAEASLSCKSILLEQIYSRIEILADVKSRLDAGEMDGNIALKSGAEIDFRAELSRMIRHYPWTYSLFIETLKEQKKNDGDMRPTQAARIARAKEVEYLTDLETHLMNINNGMAESTAKNKFDIVRYMDAIPENVRVAVLQELKESEFSPNKRQKFLQYFKDSVAEVIFSTKQNAIEKLNEYIEKSYIDINDTVTSLNDSLLHYAIREGFDEVAQYLLSHPNFQKFNSLNYYNDSVLNYSIRFRRDSITELILQRGDFQHLNQAGFQTSTVLIDAINTDHLDFVKYLATREDFNQWDISDPISHARKKKKDDIMLFLIKRKATSAVKSFWK